MLKAIDYEILRDVLTGGRCALDLARKPELVGTLIDETLFMRDQFIIHNRTLFIEDYMHDWKWADGKFWFAGRHADRVDVLVIYRYTEVEPPIRFNPHTGAPVA